MDKLEALQAFVTIVDHGSLTAAAKAHGKSLPSMVRILADLEQQLGTTLLRRTTRTMSLTEEGHMYLERSRRILADIQEADELVGHHSGEPKGQIRITAPVLFGQKHVIPTILKFAARYQEVQVDVLLLDRIVNLVEEGIDVAVRIGLPADSTMMAARVGYMRRVVVASPSFLQECGVPTHPRELCDAPCVVVQNPTGALWRFQKDGKEFNATVDGRLRFNQVSSAVHACSAGYGFGHFLAYQVAELIQENRLVMVLETWERPPIPVSLVYAESRLMSSRLRAYLDWTKPLLADRIRAVEELLKQDPWVELHKIHQVFQKVPAIGNHRQPNRNKP
jgi:DNA-binding transcriptional LysR family regulator